MSEKLIHKMRYFFVLWNGYTIANTIVSFYGRLSVARSWLQYTNQEAVPILKKLCEWHNFPQILILEMMIKILLLVIKLRPFTIVPFKYMLTPISKNTQLFRPVYIEYLPSIPLRKLGKQKFPVDLVPD